ncbi:hypothetical protein I302_102598 [Kwoniella bestiolae CBS 10118]|uniref:Uncharacterized protein n=1 Tax=Kwoniella bestiolae CBS 10118 TaxID=1296100 RepID=A0A1B9GFF2_9TREE|nr:hypothetical protein I302_01285 [Kwoniella bestiolae CBS 10118]OCF29772.1 hypothetical protein I302_01285 [Kwoniella bestiolae CBS 10118]
MSRFAPKEWSEYQNAQYRIPFKPEMPNAEYKQHYFPPTWMIHTDLSTEFPLLWGSINKIIVRPSDDTPDIDDLLPVKAKDKKRKRHHLWDNESDWDWDFTPPPEFAYAYTTRRQQEDEMAEIMGRDYKNVQTILRSIVDSHPRNFGRSLLHSDTKSQLEDKTKFEVYGLELVLELNEEADDQMRGRIREEEERVRSKFDYYALEMYESLQRQIRFRDRFWENGEDKCGPVIRFYTMGELKQD